MGINVGQHQPGFIGKKSKSDESKPAEDKDGKRIIRQVLEQLGKPPILHSCWTRATNVFENRWRVNICSGDPPGYKHSFFVTVTDDHTIISSQPEIKKEYDHDG